MRVSRATLLLLLALVACPGNEGPRRPVGTGTGPASVEGARGGVLRVLLSDDVDSLDPQRAGAPSSFGLMRALHRGLMAFPPAGTTDEARPVPDLAEAAPEISADGLRYTFRLRDDAAFSGPASRPVEARDVKAGIERIFAVRSPLARYFTVIAGADPRTSRVAGIATPDARTVVITLIRPANDLLSLLALPAASAVPAGLTPTARPNEISASGPYRLDEKDGYVPEKRIHLVRNDAWKELSDPVRRAWVDEISVGVGVDPAEIQRRLTAGRADLSGDVGPVAAIARGVPSERVVAGPNGCLRYLFMNTRVSPFTFASARNAVKAAVDRKAIAAIRPGRGIAAATILPSTVDGYDGSLAVPPAEPARAKRILAATTAFRTGFATRLVVGNRAIDRREAAAGARALRAARIRVGITPVPIASLYEDHYEVPAANVPMGIATWCADWPGLGGRGALGPLVDGRALAARGNTNYSGLHDAAVERTMDAGLAERDPAKAAAIWKVADARAAGLSAVVPLLHLTETSLLGPRVRGFVPHPYFVRGDMTAIWLESS